MAIDLDREAQAVRDDGERLQGERWLGDAAAPDRVAAYVAASERVEMLGVGEIVEIVRQGLTPEVAEANTTAVRGLARDVLLKLAEAR